ncbi:hypothetical protein K443DRAFT_117771, partial [Laccaria amethystina LaAM-08-1]
PLFETTKCCNYKMLYCPLFDTTKCPLFETTKVCMSAFLRLQKFVRCAFLIKKVCSGSFFGYKVCSVHFLRLQKFVVRFSDIL